MTRLVLGSATRRAEGICSRARRPPLETHRPVAVPTRRNRETADTLHRQRDPQSNAARPGARAWVDRAKIAACACPRARRRTSVLYSARYAGTHPATIKPTTQTPPRNGVPLQRSAGRVLRSTAVLRRPDGQVSGSVEGRCKRRLVDSRRGGGGFGYDPLFFSSWEYGQTFRRNCRRK